MCMRDSYEGTLSICCVAHNILIASIGRADAQRTVRYLDMAARSCVVRSRAFAHGRVPSDDRLQSPPHVHTRAVAPSVNRNALLLF